MRRRVNDVIEPFVFVCFCFWNNRQVGSFCVKVNCNSKVFLPGKWRRGRRRSEVVRPAMPSAFEWWPSLMMKKKRLLVVFETNQLRQVMILWMMMAVAAVVVGRWWWPDEHSDNDVDYYHEHKPSSNYFDTCNWCKDRVEIERQIQFENFLRLSSWLFLESRSHREAMGWCPK